ncbi:MAG: TetR family transcriptional regulator [Lutibacter sp.]|nr:MAG: TetR family transcriptional regulator [Lutibacter sp.]
MKQENRKDEIIHTATKLFKKKGYSAVTMRDIAKSMGIKAASLYNHINSKQEILTNIIISLAEEFTDEMNNILKSDLNSIDKLKEIISLHVKITSENTNGMASLNNDWMHLEEKLDYYLSLRHKYEEDFREIINEGISKKEISNSNSEIMLFSMLSTLRSLYLWTPNQKDINELANSLSDVLINGVKI